MGEGLVPLMVAAKRAGLTRGQAYYHVACERFPVTRDAGRLYVNPRELAKAMDQPLYTDSIGKRFFVKPGVKGRTGRRSDETIAIRFSANERLAVERSARDCQQTISDFVRTAVNEAVAELDEAKPLRIRKRQ